MSLILLFVVLLFEYDMQQYGGIFAMVKESSYAGTFFLNFIIYLHTFLSITTSIIWIYLVIASLKKFGKDPKPGKLSRTHRLWGKIGMWDMALTCITSLMVYVYGFVSVALQAWYTAPPTLSRWAPVTLARAVGAPSSRSRPSSANTSASL